MDVTITVDASCSWWKRVSVGCIVRNTETGEILEMVHRDIAGYGTANSGEYASLILGCQLAEQYKPGQTLFFTDSQLVLRQLKGDYAVKDKRLKELHSQVRTKLRLLKATVRWHGRQSGDGPLADHMASYRYKEVLNENHNRIQPDGHRGVDPRSDEAARDYITRRGESPVDNECRPPGRPDGNCAGVSI